MKISTTKQLFTEEQAVSLCKNENTGLLGKAADFLRGERAVIEILSSKLFYFPYYCTDVHMQLPKSRRVKRPALVGSVVVDGVFGIPRGMEGSPQAQELDLPASAIAMIRYTQEEAQEKTKEFVRKYIYRKFHVFPTFDALETILVYKPLYVVRCKKMNKRYYQIVDAEMGCKDYTFNFRYNEIQFSE